MCVGGKLARTVRYALGPGELKPSHDICSDFFE
jgi:hypothetical protein